MVSVLPAGDMQGRQSGAQRRGCKGVDAYDYSGYLWPSFGATALIALLAVYGWRHRGIPGAVPFTLGCLFAVAPNDGHRYPL